MDSFVSLYTADTGTRVTPGQSLGTVGPRGQRNIPGNMPTPGQTFGRAHNRDIPKIIETYLMNDWGDNHQDRIRKGMLVFAYSGIDRTPLQRTTIASWAKLNQLLRDEYDNVQALFEKGNMTPGYAEIGEFYEMLKQGGDNFVANLIKHDGPKVKNTALRNAVLTNPTIAYLTRDGIMHLWHFLGGVEVAEMPASAPRPERNVRYRTIAVVVDKNVKIKNYFANYKKATSGTSCWIILKRVQVNGKWGPYQLVPYHSDYSGRPPRSARYYEDLSGRPQLGACIFVGTIYRPPERNISERIRKVAYGAIGANELASHEVTPSLPFMEIVLRR